MKIEELPHISIKRNIPSDRELKSCWLSGERKNLMLRKGYIPNIDCMSDSYSILSRLLDEDCVVAYVTDKSQTTFLIKTKRQYVGFICISERLTKYLSSNSTRQITKLYNWRNSDKNEFIDFTKDDDLIITDKDKWDIYLKTKLLESLEMKGG